MKNIRTIALFVLLFSFLANSYGKKEAKREKKKPIISAQEQRKLDYYFYEAMNQKQLGELDGTIDLLTECYFIDPHNAAVLYEFAMAYTNIQDVKYAIQFMTLASIEDKSNSWYKMGLAELYVKNHDYANAIIIYKDIAKNHPEANNVDYMLASLYGQTQQAEKSIEYLNKVEKKNGINETISFEKYRLYDAIEKKKKAYSEIEKLIERFPLEARYQLLRAEIYLQEENKPNKAFEIYQKLKQADPNNILLILAMHDYYKSNSDTIRANKVFKEAFENQEISLEDKIGLLTQFISFENQSASKAEEFFKLLISKHPNNETLHTYYASFLLMQRRYKDAVPELQKMLKINPKNKDGWIELIKVYIDQEEPKIADAMVDSALSYLPNESVFYMHKGLNLISKENYNDALAAFTNGLQVTTEEEQEKKAEFLLYIADIYATQKMMDLALEKYEKAYQLNPNNALLLNNYAYYLSVVNKDLSKAEIMSAKTIQIFPNNISFLDTYAWIFFKQKNMTLAYMYIQQAMDKGGDENPVVLEHYGDILFLNGDKESAIKWWLKAKEKGNKSDLLQEKIDNQNYIPAKKDD